LYSDVRRLIDSSSWGGGWANKKNGGAPIESLEKERQGAYYPASASTRTSVACSSFGELCRWFLKERGRGIRRISKRAKGAGTRRGPKNDSKETRCVRSRVEAFGEEDGYEFKKRR